MELVSVILSSAVLVAIIQFFQGNKGNQLQYITEERTEWRKSIKEIIQEISTSSLKNVEKSLVKLKSNLNGYGYHYAKHYPVVEQLDYMKDEHIWLEIEKIEQAVKAKDKETFVFHKERLIIGLIMLLKFDWERSKKEVYGESGIPIAAALFLFGVMAIFIAKFGFSGIGENIEDCIRWGSIMLYLYGMAWLPCILGRPKVFRTKKWYRNLSAVFVPTIFFLVFTFVFNEYREGIESDLQYLSIFLCYASFMFTIVCPVILDNVYRNYDNKLIEIFSSSILRLYKTSPMNELCCIYFKRYNIFIDMVNISELDIRQMFSDSRVSDLVAQRKEYQLLRRRSQMKYLFKRWLAEKRNGIQIDIQDFIQENPHRCKFVLEYINENKEIKYCVGKNKKIWKEWMNGEDSYL